MTKAGDEKARKEAGQRIRECFEKERTHVRVGDWRSLDGCTVRLVGTAKDLHGPKGRCTCCRRRST